MRGWRPQSLEAFWRACEWSGIALVPATTHRLIALPLLLSQGHWLRARQTLEQRWNRKPIATSLTSSMSSSRSLAAVLHDNNRAGSGLSRAISKTGSLSTIPVSWAHLRDPAQAVVERGGDADGDAANPAPPLMKVRPRRHRGGRPVDYFDASGQCRSRPSNKCSRSMRNILRDLRRAVRRELFRIGEDLANSALEPDVDRNSAKPADRDRSWRSPSMAFRADVTLWRRRARLSPGDAEDGGAGNQGAGARRPDFRRHDRLHRD